MVLWFDWLGLLCYGEYCKRVFFFFLGGGGTFKKKIFRSILGVMDMGVSNISCSSNGSFSNVLLPLRVISGRVGAEADGDYVLCRQCQFCCCVSQFPRRPRWMSMVRVMEMMRVSYMTLSG